MGDVFESVVPEEHYIDEIERLSVEIWKLETEVKNLKLTLIKTKSLVTDFQFLEPDSKKLENVCELINKSLSGD